MTIFITSVLAVCWLSFWNLRKSLIVSVLKCVSSVLAKTGGVLDIVLVSVLADFFEISIKC